MSCGNTLSDCLASWWRAEKQSFPARQNVYIPHALPKLTHHLPSGWSAMGWSLRTLPLLMASSSSSSANTHTNTQTSHSLNQWTPHLLRCPQPPRLAAYLTPPPAPPTHLIVHSLLFFGPTLCPAHSPSPLSTASSFGCFFGATPCPASFFFFWGSFLLGGTATEEGVSMTRSPSLSLHSPLLCSELSNKRFRRCFSEDTNGLLFASGCDNVVLDLLVVL